MKRLLVCFLCVMLTALFVFSCQQNDEILDNDKENGNKEKIESDEKTDDKRDVEIDQPMTFTYQGEMYASDYSLENQSYIFQDTKVQEIFDEVMQLSELCTYVNEKGVIEYYDNYKEFEKAENLKLRIKWSRETTWARLLIYDETCFMGKCNYFYLDSLTSLIGIPDLDGYFADQKLNMKNLVSSFEVKTFYNDLNGTLPSEKHGNFTTVIFFENTNYGGRSRVWKGNPYNEYVSEPSLEYFNWGASDSPTIDKNISSLIFKFTDN